MPKKQIRRGKPQPILGAKPVVTFEAISQDKMGRPCATGVL